MNTLEWLARLIAFDTTSRHSNLELINDIDAWFKQHHIATRLTHDPKQPKANLFATLPAHDGSLQGGLVLSGHTDVVPVDGQTWDTNPFQATPIENKIYGRGACDMKGFVAVVLALVPELQKQALPHPIHFAFSFDEEIGCRGVPLLIADMQAIGIKPSACIVGEPTDMRPVIAHKGIHVLRCTLQGYATHSSLTPSGCNAIEYAAELICYLRAMANAFKEKGQRDAYFDVPFTTLSTNLIKGGNAYNTVPSHCEFIFEFRHLPTDDPQQIRKNIERYVQDELLPKMQTEHHEATIHLDEIAAAPSFEISPDAAIAKIGAAVSGETDIKKVAYGTEAGWFQQADVPTIVCGPGSIEQAHRANEFVTIEQLQRCEVFLRKISLLEM